MATPDWENSAIVDERVQQPSTQKAFSAFIVSPQEIMILSIIISTIIIFYYAGIAKSFEYQIQKFSLTLLATHTHAHNWTTLLSMH